MKKLDDPKNCVQIKDNGLIKTYCVECDAWRVPVVEAIAKVTMKQMSQPMVDRSDIESFTVICRFCGADLDYLLDCKLRDQVINAIFKSI